MNMDGLPDDLDVLVVLGHLGHGGSQRVVATIVPVWVDMGLRVGIWLSRGARPADRAYRIPGAVWVGGGEKGLGPGDAGVIERARAAMGSVRDLRTTIKRSNARVVISLLCTTNIKAIIASLGLKGIKLTISERNDPSRQYFPSHIRLARRVLYRRADLITANSERALDWLRRIAPKTEMRVLPNPVVVPGGVAESDRGDGVFEILYVGRIVRQKRIENLVYALQMLREGGANVCLRIVGDGPGEERIRQVVDACGVAPHVQLDGYRENVESAYRTASCFGLLSEYEGLPNALLEAMVMCIPPVISTEANESAGLVEHECNGMEVDGRNVTEVARAIDRLVNDRVMRVNMGAEASRVAMRFEVSHVVQVWNHVLGLDTGGYRRVERATE
jgi:glycosyltransferase involved in cell wall biosynthesis